MTGNETTDAGLTPDEAQELRALLHRAADQLEVVTPSPAAATSASTDATLRAERRRGGVRGGGHRWTIGAVAAAVLLLAGGAWFVSDTDDAQRITTGGPDGSSEGVTDVTAGAIWQWPETIPDGLEVTWAGTSTSWVGFQIAVDDPATPTRWLAITPTWFGFSTGATDTPIASGTLESGATYALYGPRTDSTTGATWAELIGPGQTGYLTIAALGVDPQAIIDVLAEVDGRPGNLTSAPELDAALRDMTLPDGLVPAWNPDRVGFASGSATVPSALSLVLGSPEAGDRIGLSIDEVGMAPAVASLDLQLRLDANDAGHGFTGQTVTRRDDLGPGSLIVDDHDQTTVYLFSDDGVRLSASGVMSGPAGDVPTTVGVPALVDVLHGLRVVTESDLRDRLEAAGLDLVPLGEPGDDGSSPTTTVAPTTTPGPTTTVAG